MQTNYGYLLLLFMSAAKALPLQGEDSKDFENSEITIKQVHLKPNQTLEVLLEIQSKASEQDTDGDRIGSVAGQILNEFYEQKKLSGPGGAGDRDQYTVTKQKHITKRPPIFAKPGSEDDEAEAPVRIQTQNLAHIGTDTEVDIYEEIERTPRPYIPEQQQNQNINPIYIPIPNQNFQTNLRNPAEDSITIESTPVKAQSAPVKSNAEIISNIVANVNAENPRGWNKTVVYQEPYQFQPVAPAAANTNSNNLDAQANAGTFTISNFGSQAQSGDVISNIIPSTNNNNNNNNGPIAVNFDGQQSQSIPISNIISLPPEVTAAPPTTAGIPVEVVRPTAAPADEDDDDDDDEDEDSVSRVARTK